MALMFDRTRARKSTATFDYPTAPIVVGELELHHVRVTGYRSHHRLERNVTEHKDDESTRPHQRQFLSRS
jgi:hypothetical protein